MTVSKQYALILAGGKGTRLWPLSRENYPKQFVEFQNGLSLFQLTIQRLLNSFELKDIFVISQEIYKFTIFNQIEFIKGISLKDKQTLKDNVIFEPQPKNTLPAILLSLKFIEQIRGMADQDLLYVFPSDHVIDPISVFKTSMKKARVLAEKGKIVVFGVKPTFPKEGFGYVMVKGKFGEGFIVDKFVEKPDTAKAKQLLKKGAFWNAGIFCFSKAIFLGELLRLQPQMDKFYDRSYPEFAGQFKNLPSISIDYGIMQQTRKTALVPFNLRWSDLGSWDSFLNFHSKKGENFYIGKAEFMDSKNCFAFTKNRLVCMVGLEDVIAIDSPDSLLLIKKGQTDNVKDLVTRINNKGHNHTKDSLTVYRPWGYYTILHEEKDYKVKEIGVYPKKTVSLQKHKFRSEHWNVVEGEVSILVDGQERRAKKNQSCFVPLGAKHKIYNPTNKTAKIIETQIGSYLGEDDIVRFISYD